MEGWGERNQTWEEEAEVSTYHNLHTFPSSSSRMVHQQIARSGQSVWFAEGTASGVREDVSDLNYPHPMSISLQPDDVHIEREHMFDKVVTPSDVGKLNRLVIPKQHAEKYFPLDSSSNEKGLLLCFEDRTGKPWKFRYSYWNSSQSYVMTKGWSRFVKEKKLDAGDIVSFGRGVGELGKGRLYIDWRRRPDSVQHQPPIHGLPLSYPGQVTRPVHWGPFFFPQQQNFHQFESGGYSPINAPPAFYMNPQRVGSHGGVHNGGIQMLMDTAPVVHPKMEPKRVRLFGVNLECANESESLSCLQDEPNLPVTSLQVSDQSSTSMTAETPRNLMTRFSFDLDG